MFTVELRDETNESKPLTNIDDIENFIGFKGERSKSLNFQLSDELEYKANTSFKMEVLPRLKSK